MQQIKINSVEQIYNDENYIKYNVLDNIDARGIDLSSFPSSSINDILNCNLENTNLKIFLDNTAEYRIADSNIIGTQLVTKKNNQDNSNNNSLFTLDLNNVIFDKEQIQYLNQLYKKNKFMIHYDLNTILNNDGILIDSIALLALLDTLLYNLTFNTTFFNKEDLHNIVEKIEQVISKDVMGNLKNVYNNIANQLSDYEKIMMFKKTTIKNVTFSNLEITNGMYDLLKIFSIKECNLENVVFDSGLDNMFFNDDYDYYKHSYNSIKNIQMPNIKYNDWQSIKANRISSTPFTFKKNLYLELGRNCNAKCPFCRNNCMEKCRYKFKEIIKNFNVIMNDVDFIFIGGGEPTINKNDLQKLLKNAYKNAYLSYRSSNIYTFSNGSADLDFYKNLDANIYISRHHYDDDINAQIFNLSKKKILKFEQIAELHNRLTLACTCINGGIDSVDKIIKYLQTADEYGIENIVFSNLHDDASVNAFDKAYKNLNIKSEIIDEAIKILGEQGFNYEYPIISSGGYKMYMLKNDFSRKRVVFKQYISKEELEQLWPYAIKRTFDLSMAPDGSIYENWAQDGHKVKVFK